MIRFIKKFLFKKPKNLSFDFNINVIFPNVGLRYNKEFKTISSARKFQEMYEKGVNYHYNPHGYKLYEPLDKRLRKDLISIYACDTLELRNKPWRFI